MEAITEKIPQTLLYEEFGGRKYYRRGYRQVLLGLKNESEIIGSSFLQGLIVQAIVGYLKSTLPKKEYWTPTNEVGLHARKKENFSGDILICEKSKSGNPWVKNYTSIPPKFIIEVDIKIDPTDYSTEPVIGSEMAYMVQKSEKLIDFGVEGIAWILTESRKILLMRPNRRLEVFEWTDEVPLFGEYSFCLQTILEEEDILPPSE
jgi:hypothetical protein